MVLGVVPVKSKACNLRYCSKNKGTGQSYITMRVVSSFEMVSCFERTLCG